MNVLYFLRSEIILMDINVYHQIIGTEIKLINNSSSVSKGNHDRDVVWISDLN